MQKAGHIIPKNDTYIKTRGAKDDTTVLNKSVCNKYRTHEVLRAQARRTAVP